MTFRPTDVPEPSFAEPWHAQLFALTVKLNEDGLFAWTDWAARFSQTLKAHGVAKDLDGGDDYFRAWLETLEALLAEEGRASRAEAETMKAAWTQAYLNTPHGAPVRLSDDP